MDPERDLAHALLEGHLNRPAWHRRAACRGQGPENWFGRNPDNTDNGKTICQSCPVRDDCLDYALAEPTWLQGTWGGTGQAERRQLRRQRRTA